jgi:hypothetical protein
MRELRNPTMIDPSVQVIAMVLREKLQRRKIYTDYFEFLCSTCGSLADEWGYSECRTGRNH